MIITSYFTLIETITELQLLTKLVQQSSPCKLNRSPKYLTNSPLNHEPPNTGISHLPQQQPSCLSRIYWQGSIHHFSIARHSLQYYMPNRPKCSHQHPSILNLTIQKPKLLLNNNQLSYYNGILFNFWSFLRVEGVETLALIQISSLFTI
jgi:hypothetical protein